MNPGSVVPLAHEPLWGEPDWTILADGGLASAFPIKLLGPFWGPWVEDRARAASAPVDFVGAALLATAAGVIGNTRWPQAGATWTDPPALWIALVAPPAGGKTPALKQVQPLVRAAETVLCDGFAERKREHDASILAAREREKAWEREAKLAVDEGIAPPQRPADTYEPAPLQRPRITVADATPEALGALSAALPRGLLSLHDELAAWASFNKYNTSGTGRQFWLEAYGGGRFPIDRKSAPEPILVDHLTISVLGGVQPDRLRELIDGGDDGLWARFLWCSPAEFPAITIARTAEPQHAAEDAFKRLAGLIMRSTPESIEEPVHVALEPDAVDALEAFQRECRHRGERLPGMVSTLGKAGGHALRLALVLAYLRWSATPHAPEPDTVSVEDVKRGIGLMDGYFIPMATRALGGDGLSQGEHDAKALAKWLQAKELDVFNARDVRRSITGPLANATRMEAACNALCGAGFLRKAFTRAGSTSGRQRKDYAVHPALRGAAQ